MIRDANIRRSLDGDRTRMTVRGAMQPHAAERHPVVQMRRALGNKAFGDMLNASSQSRLPAGVQAKLTVGPAGDAFEQEADQVGKWVADRISSSPDGAQPVQRESLPEEEQLQLKRTPEGIQREAMPEEEELQLKRSEDGFDADAELEQSIERSRGNGLPMDGRVQAKMESAFGTGFGEVNIHTDGEADRMARSIGASAFTAGSDVFFRQGQYNPESRQGQELLGHELTHVVQQRGGVVSEDDRRA